MSGKMGWEIRVLPRGTTNMMKEATGAVHCGPSLRRCCVLAFADSAEMEVCLPKSALGVVENRDTRLTASEETASSTSSPRPILWRTPTTRCPKVDIS